MPKPSSGKKTGGVVKFFKEGDDLSEAFRPTEAKLKFAQEILKAPVGTEIKTWHSEKEKRILKIIENKNGEKFLSFINGEVPHYLRKEFWLNSPSDINKKTGEYYNKKYMARSIAAYLQTYGQITYHKKRR